MASEGEVPEVRVLVNIGHPAHVHFFKNFIWQMRKMGHELLISAVDKDVTLRLLEAYRLDYDLCGRRGGNILSYIGEVVKRDYHVFGLTRRFKPDVIVGIGDLFGAHVSKITKAKSIVFTDTEHAKLVNMVTFRFADVILTPSCFAKDLGRKQVRYDGYQELAYLHPNRFKPDPSVLGELGLTEGETFIILRFVSWGASHDMGQHGFVCPRDAISRLQPYGRVLITSERRLGSDLEEYRIALGPERLHDLLYYATLYVGEGATLASESAMVGTPAVYLNTQRLGYLDEQEKEYGLVYNFSGADTSQRQAIDKAVELLNKDDLKEEWRAKRDRLLADKIDVTQFVVDFVECYPESLRTYKGASVGRL